MSDNKRLNRRNFIKFSAWDSSSHISFTSTCYGLVEQKSPKCGIRFKGKQ